MARLLYRPTALPPFAIEVSSNSNGSLSLGVFDLPDSRDLSGLDLPDRLSDRRDLSDIVPDSSYTHPRPLLRRVQARILLILIGGAVFGIAAQAALVLLYPRFAVLLCGSMVFTAILLLPLLAQTVMYPAITLSANGLTVHPLFWKAQRIAWADIERIEPHPMIVNDEVMGRRLHGKNYRPRKGMVIVLRRSARVNPLYRIVGQIVGAGAAFGISNTTHTDYERLLGSLMDKVSKSHQ
jgi:hypothetical protein